MNLKQKFPRLYMLYEHVEDDYLGLVAAGVAFYFLMAAFPALAAAISFYGIFSDPAFVNTQLESFSQFLPPEALKILSDQTRSLLESSQHVLSISLLVGIFLAIYSSTKGVSALIKGLNIAYNEKEKRGYIRLVITDYILTAGLMVYMLASLTMIAILPAIFSILRLPAVTAYLFLLIRWPLLFVSALVGLQILYTFAPSRLKYTWRWVSIGSIIATTLWMIGSYLFSLFVTFFGNYNETYGSISAIVVLLLWFWLSAAIILLGAEINHVFEPEHGELQRKDLNLSAGS